MISSIEIQSLMQETEYFRKAPELLLQFILYKLLADQGEALSLKAILAEGSVQAILEKISDEFRRLNQVPAYRDLFVQIIPVQLELDIYSNEQAGDNFSFEQSTSFFSPEVIKISFLKNLDQLDLTNYSPNDWGEIYDLVLSLSSFKILRRRTPFGLVSELERLIIGLALMDKREQKLSVYDPNVELGYLLTMAFNKKNKLNGHKKWHSYLLVRFNFLAHGIPEEQCQIQFGDPIENDWQTDQATPEKFDVVVSDLSKGESWSGHKELAVDYRFKNYTLPPKSMAEYLYILHGLAHLKDDGVMVVCLPAGALYRVGLEEKLRKELIEQQVIESLIAVPTRYTTQARRNSVVMVLRKKNREKRPGIYMLDVNDQIGNSLMQIFHNYQNQSIVPGRSTIASWETVAANDYNLTILKYVMSRMPQTAEEQIEYQMSAYLREEQRLREGEKKLRRLMRRLDSDRYGQMLHRGRQRIDKIKE
ncbi:N-6 DNA methylase [Limosilactobacillus ingluviei]|uniref:N-6 DNA methylase n=1 Tax=Limosilactobacillus ingluviei TaxID=148604 RepID=UPI0024B98C00|nr:N-6 DNA methylase [Limosilactobacillus ingluviei]